MVFRRTLVDRGHDLLAHDSPGKGWTQHLPGSFHGLKFGAASTKVWKLELISWNSVCVPPYILYLNESLCQKYNQNFENICGYSFAGPVHLQLFYGCGCILGP